MNLFHAEIDLATSDINDLIPSHQAIFPLEAGDFFVNNGLGFADWTLSGVNQLTETGYSTQAVYSLDSLTGVEFDTFVTVQTSPGIPPAYNSIGVVFGYQNTESFYIAQFKGVTSDDNPLNWGTNFDGTPRGTTVDGNPVLYFARGGLSVKRVFGPLVDYALWATDSAAFSTIVETIYDNSMSFSSTTGRVSWEYFTQYKIHVSYRASTGYYRVTMVEVATNNVIADTGDQWDAAGAGRGSGAVGVYVLGEEPVTWDQPVYKCCDGYVASNGDCMPWTVCDIFQTQLVEPTASSDRVCSN
jgi:hypothetical protein